MPATSLSCIYGLNVPASLRLDPILSLWRLCAHSMLPDTHQALLHTFSRVLGLGFLGFKGPHAFTLTLQSGCTDALTHYCFVTVTILLLC